jgi:hypothetical protein
MALARALRSTCRMNREAVKVQRFSLSAAVLRPQFARAQSGDQLFHLSS